MLAESALGVFARRTWAAESSRRQRSACAHTTSRGKRYRPLNDGKPADSYPAEGSPKEGQKYQKTCGVLKPFDPEFDCIQPRRALQPAYKLARPSGASQRCYTRPESEMNL